MVENAGSMNNLVSKIATQSRLLGIKNCLRDRLNTKTKMLKNV